MTDKSYQDAGSLHLQFHQQAKRTPDRLAVSDGKGHSLSYAELDTITDNLAAALREKGLDLDDCGIIYMERCIEYVVAYIAILKAGGAYMPMDVSYPPNLVQDVLEDCQAKVILTKPILFTKLPVSAQASAVVFDSDWQETISKKKIDTTKIPVEVSLDNLAFIVYSSGTTGKPKGIAMPHRGAVFSYHWRHVTYPYDDTTEQERDACNVFFVWEMLRPLLKGQALFIIPDDVIYDPPKLLDFLKTNRITRMLFTPSLLETVLDSKPTDIENCLALMKQIWLCGEVVTTTLLERCVTSLPKIRIINLYSISECHDVAASDLSEYYQRIKARPEDKRKFCPVGCLLPGVKVAIFDEDFNLQPVGVPGEIYVAGPTVARGYIKRPELNRQKFIAPPQSILRSGYDYGDRLYRTGDWGYLLTDGSLEICGRCDSMVKIRGYSVEVQAVEAALHGLVEVNTAVVLVKGAEGEDKFLVAYVVPSTDKVTKRQLRQSLKNTLPFYMIPSYFVFLQELPVSAIGKLDKKALPAFDKLQDSTPTEFLAQTPVEKILTEIWKKTLSIEAVDIQDSFFDYGGHSLLAARLLASVNKEFATDISVKDLFLFPTVQQMARLIEARKAKSDNPPPEYPQKMDLRSEVSRHDQSHAFDLDIQLRAFWRNPLYNKSRWTRGRVLLTGATGFLGSFILRDLINMTDTQVYCMVRETSTEGLLERVRQSLNQFDILPLEESRRTEQEREFAAKLESRVTAIKSDITLVRFGLSEDDYGFLSSEIDVIIHAAAYVNLIYPYSALYGPNVLGTQNVIVFASNIKVKPIHYVSTDAVFPNNLNNCLEDADVSGYHSDLTDGYSQSKWVAEQLVLKAKQRGMPVIVYRLGNMAGDRQNAGWNPQDFTLLMLHGILASGQAPNLKWKLEMTPVDFASEFIVRMIKHLSKHAGSIFHITQPQSLDFSMLCEWMQLYGYDIKTVPYQQWLVHLQALSGKVPQVQNLSRLLEDMAPTESFFEQLSSYDNRHLCAVLKSMNLSYPTLDSSLLTVYFGKLTKKGILPRVRRQTVTGALVGKVAVVTGASSGIGQAAAQALAKEGCAVSLIARRSDLLNIVKNSIEVDGGTAICCRADVTNRSEMKAAFERTENLLGPVDFLVNSAGVMYFTLVESCHGDEADRMIDVNCKGVTTSIECVVQSMVSRKSGHIVNISSDAGRVPFQGMAVYTGTKFFVEGYSRAMRKELAVHGIRVTCIQPGDVRTPLQHMSTETETAALYSGLGKYKMLECEDIARAIVYAIKQPVYVAINEILIEPIEAPA